LTWGCKPGFVCSPPKPDSCNVWIDSPSDDYQCKPAFCIEAPEFEPTFWPTNTTSFYPAISGYFDLDPNAFGLSFGIFSEEVVVEEVGGRLTTVTTGDWSTQTSLTHFPPPSSAASPSQPNAAVKRGVDKRHRLSKRDDSIVPAVCYDSCNNCYLEAQSVGKTQALCNRDSPFELYYQACNSCITHNQPESKLSTKRYLVEKFGQFLHYCDTSCSPSRGFDLGST